jgi:hypothetical protein
MKKHILVFLFLLCYVVSFAQTSDNLERKNQLEFSTGYNSGFLKNLALAPLSRYEYKGLNYQLKYTRTTKKYNLFEIQLDYLKSELKSDLIPTLNIADYSKSNLNFTYLKHIYNKNKFSIHLGLQSQTTVSSFFEWELYDFQQKLGIASRFTYKIGEKQLISSKITLPFMMWRTSTFEENFYSIDKYQSILWSTEYKYELSNRFDLKANYNFNYDRLKIFNAYRELQHQINLGINFKF